MWGKCNGRSNYLESTPIILAVNFCIFLKRFCHNQSVCTYSYQLLQGHTWEFKTSRPKSTLLGDIFRQIWRFNHNTSFSEEANGRSKLESTNNVYRLNNVILFCFNLYIFPINQNGMFKTVVHSAILNSATEARYFLC